MPFRAAVRELYIASQTNSNNISKASPGGLCARRGPATNFAQIAHTRVGPNVSGATITQSLYQRTNVQQRLVVHVKASELFGCGGTCINPSCAILCSLCTGARHTHTHKPDNLSATKCGTGFALIGSQKPRCT